MIKKVPSHLFLHICLLITVSIVHGQTLPGSTFDTDAESTRQPTLKNLHAEIENIDQALIREWRMELVELQGQPAEEVRLAHAEFLRDRFERLVALEEKRLQLAELEEEADIRSPSPSQTIAREFRSNIKAATEAAKTATERRRIRAEQSVGERIMVLEAIDRAGTEG